MTTQRRRKYGLSVLTRLLLIGGSVAAGFALYLHQHAVGSAAFSASDSRASSSHNTEQRITLVLADDGNGSLTPVAVSRPLPAGEAEQAAAILNALFAEYARPQSHHPVAPGQAVARVTLSPLPRFVTPGPSSDLSRPPAPEAPLTQKVQTPGSSPVPLEPGGAYAADGMPDQTPPQGSQRELAVVDLSPSFAANHNSGIEPETLSLLSILATLHANLPAIEQVRFLVGGRPQETLAGHADLMRVYLASAPGVRP